jgi:exopolyphosphatase/guanosine-5'-triphosphate,3'-diphosphate pyrophosphatase
MVRLAAGLDENGRLSKEATDRALAALARFGQRLRDMRADSVRVVGTNTLRKARRKAGFFERAHDALGHPIEIISGIEEARLIYQGVVHTTSLEQGRHFVVDIGGGSTECIIGDGRDHRILESLYMGCVAVSARHFANGRVSARQFQNAVVACSVELEPLEVPFRAIGWEHAIGSSGTVRAIGEALRELEPANKLITRGGLRELAARIIAAGNVRRAGFKTIDEERWPVFPGGLAILTAVFDTLGIESMKVADGALREGLLYDMLGRLRPEDDARERSVRSMAARFHTDTEQAARVEHSAADILQDVRAAWNLEDALADQVLSWAARLHEIGLDISHSGHHKHAAYLLQHAEMPGFPREEQALLACIVGMHRRKLTLEPTEDLVPPWHVRAVYLALVLRLAVLLHRGRSRSPLPPMRFTAKSRSLEIRFPRGWLSAHPLTRADLTLESEYLAAAGIRFSFA